MKKPKTPKPSRPSAEPVYFSPDTYRFLRALKRNNRKAWFKAHEEEYQAFVRQPTLQFVERIDRVLKRQFPEVVVHRRNISRINRDTRFSANKAPYKSWVNISFPDLSRGSKDVSGPGLYFGYDFTGYLFGAGIFFFDKPLRARFREWVTHPTEGAEFAKIVRALRKRGFEFGGKDLKKIPPGFDATHPNAEFLLYNGFYASIELDPKKEFFGPRVDAWFVEQFKPTRALYVWMRRMARESVADLEAGARVRKPTASKAAAPRILELPEGGSAAERPQFDF